MWTYFDKPKGDFRDTYAEKTIMLPAFIEGGAAKIDIRNPYSDGVYESTIWWFNRGIRIVGSDDNIKSAKECAVLTDKRLSEFLVTCAPPRLARIAELEAENELLRDTDMAITNGYQDMVVELENMREALQKAEAENAALVKENTRLRQGYDPFRGNQQW